MFNRNHEFESSRPLESDLRLAQFDAIPGLFSSMAFLHRGLLIGIEGDGLLTAE
jgi:hypothetical protein